MFMDIKNINISDYNYNLPDERIAKYPKEERDNSSLLIYNHGEIITDRFYNLTDYLPSNSLMVFNNTKVIQARLHFKKLTGALIEVFLLEPYSPSDYERVFQTTHECSWLCLVGNLKKWKEGVLTSEFDVNGKHIVLTAKRGDLYHTCHRIDFEWNEEVTFADILDAAGELPIPPYLNRETQESDKNTYQTVYSKIKGSVAAPTAGLHFTQRVLSDIDMRGIERDEITLHVGAGTFKPVKSETIEGHEMHTEYISVHKSTLERLKEYNGQAIAVGTTSVRTLESLYYMGLRLFKNANSSGEELHIDQWEPYETTANITPLEATECLLAYMESKKIEVLHSSTQIIIVPGYEYKIVKMLITNFHQPQSTLLLLVSAFVNGNWRKIYDYALSHDFRFLSYGDSSLLIP